MDAGKRVEVKIEPVYSEVSQRPVEFRIKQIIDGEESTDTIPNRNGG